MKQCFKCLASKPLSEFYKHPMMGDGHLNKCKACTKRDVSEHRSANLEKVRAYDRARGSLPHRVAERALRAKSDKYKQKKKEQSKRFRIERSDRYLVKTLVSNAIRDGRLLKQPCWVCGEAKSQAHHGAYDRPMDVSWFCAKHHAQLHKEHREWLRQEKASAVKEQKGSDATGA